MAHFLKLSFYMGITNKSRSRISASMTLLAMLFHLSFYHLYLCSSNSCCREILLAFFLAFDILISEGVLLVLQKEAAL